MEQNIVALLPICIIAKGLETLQNIKYDSDTHSQIIDIENDFPKIYLC